MALSPKSNSSYLAIDKAINAIETKNIGSVPKHIKSPFTGYKYPHDFKNSIVKQDYLPEGIKNDKYYIPKDIGYEKTLKTTKENIEKAKEMINK